MKKDFFSLDFFKCIHSFFLKRCIIILQNSCCDDRKVALISFSKGKRPIQKLAGIFLFLFFTSLNLFAQTNSVSGTVKDGNDLPLAGVSIVVKGTSTGTSSDEAGKFTIAAPAKSTLVFSNVGFDNQEVTLGGETTVAVKMVS